MKTLFVVFAVGSAIGVSNNAFSTTRRGSLAVTGSIIGSLALTIQPAGGNDASAETIAAAATLANTRMFSSASTAFTAVPPVSDWFPSNLDVIAVKANTPSSNYTVTAQFANNLDSGLGWSVHFVSVNFGWAASLSCSKCTNASTPHAPWTTLIHDHANAGMENVRLMAISN